jgi:hypothetical protein
MHLSSCPDCSRHVRVNESACPFCGVSLDLDGGEPILPQRRLGRAALFAFGATLASGVTLAGCGSDDDDGGGGTGGTGATGGSGGGSGGSSGTAGTAGSGGTAGSASGGTAGLQAAYGLPPDSGI